MSNAKIIFIATVVAFATALVTASIVVYVAIVHLSIPRIHETAPVAVASLIQLNGTDNQNKNEAVIEFTSKPKIEAVQNIERAEHESTRTLRAQPWHNSNYNRVSGLPVGFPKEYYKRVNKTNWFAS